MGSDPCPRTPRPLHRVGPAPTPATPLWDFWDLQELPAIAGDFCSVHPARLLQLARRGPPAQAIATPGHESTPEPPACRLAPRV